MKKIKNLLKKAHVEYLLLYIERVYMSNCLIDYNLIKTYFSKEPMWYQVVTSILDAYGPKYENSQNSASSCPS